MHEVNRLYHFDNVIIIKNNNKLDNNNGKIVQLVKTYVIVIDNDNINLKGG